MMNDKYPIWVGDEYVRCEQDLLERVENGRYMQGSASVRFLVIHCSATRCNRNYTVEQLLRDHQARKFYTIGYHFYIRRDGTVSQHRKLLEVGAHARGYNRCSIGICYEGGLDTQGNPSDTRTPAQHGQLMELLMKLHRLFPQAQIAGHRDLPGVKKACPCFDATAEYGWICKH